MRVKLRQDLKCHSFMWFLKNVYPELYTPSEKDILKQGEVCLL